MRGAHGGSSSSRTSLVAVGRPSAAAGARPCFSRIQAMVHLLTLSAHPRRLSRLVFISVLHLQCPGRCRSASSASRLRAGGAASPSAASSPKSSARQAGWGGCSLPGKAVRQCRQGGAGTRSLDHSLLHAPSPVLHAALARWAPSLAATAQHCPRHLLLNAEARCLPTMCHIVSAFLLGPLPLRSLTESLLSCWPKSGRAPAPRTGSAACWPPASGRCL